MVKAFLAASAKGFEFAAAQPEAAAELFLQACEKEYAASPLPEPLDRQMVTEAQVRLAFLLPVHSALLSQHCSVLCVSPVSLHCFIK